MNTLEETLLAWREKRDAQRAEQLRQFDRLTAALVNKEVLEYETRPETRDRQTLHLSGEVE